MQDTLEIVDKIRMEHRRRRFAMKLQQKMDRGLESFVRVNATDWRPDMPQEERKRYNHRAHALIAAIRKGAYDESIEIIRPVVEATDRGREPADALRRDHEAEMVKLVRRLSIHAWAKQIRGVGDLGIATIIAETGDLSNYPTRDKVWKRLGFAPYQGLAGSTWKRESWRPRSLTKDEWIENPFSGERYATMHQIGLWLVTAQVEAAKKSGTEFGRAKEGCRYGEVYVRRRERTLVTHPEWSKQHARMDAIRVTMKKFLSDFWREWRRASMEVPEGAKAALLAANTVQPATAERSASQLDETTVGMPSAILENAV